MRTGDSGPTTKAKKSCGLDLYSFAKFDTVICSVILLLYEKFIIKQ
jgi:hypothetical protein